MLLPQAAILDVLLNLLISKYFTHLNCINYLMDDKNKLFDIFTINPMIIYNARDDSQLHEYLYRFGCHGFISITTDPRGIFDRIENAIRFTPSIKFHERRYLLLASTDNSSDFFQSIALDYVADVVLVRVFTAKFEFWTHTFVGNFNHKSAILLDTWNSQDGRFAHNANLYPDKLKDFQGRALRISTFDYKPYINIDSEHGIELMMTKEYAKLYNMTSKLIIETEFWGVFFDNNYTATGAKGTLWTDKADISLGSWYRLPNYTKYFDLTETTVRIGVTFLVPTPKLAGGWFTLLFSFSTYLWIGFIVTYMILTVAFFCYEFAETRMHETTPASTTAVCIHAMTITTVTLFLQQSLDIFLNLRGAHLRIMLAIVMIFSLLFSAIYTAGFASVMTVPRYAKSIEDSADLDASGIKWGAIHPALLDGFRELPKYANVVKNILVLNNEQIRERMHQKEFAMLADRVPNGLVLATRIDVSDVKYYRVLKDDLYSDHCNCLVKRSSVLVPSIRKAFLSMKEAGLPYYWEIQAFFEENYEAQEALALKTEDNHAIQLQWMHVQGAFGLLWIGLALASLIFVWELIRMKHQQKTKRFSID